MQSPNAVARGDGLPFTGTALLAPMEGVTESCFRDLVLERNPPQALGGAFTEFARVVEGPLPLRQIRRQLGPQRHAAPVGLQLMGQRDDALAETARLAEEIGLPLVDLNFGCPAKGALRGCAGAALLDDPRRVEQIVGACVRAVRRMPITAKIRSGGADDSKLEQIAAYKKIYSLSSITTSKEHIFIITKLLIVQNGRKESQDARGVDRSS
jgi:tRNA-dihydrouridine synthase